MITAAGAGDLAALAEDEVRRHPPRTPQRRAAAALWSALVTTSSADAARRALPGFAAPETVTAALALLARLASEPDVPAHRGAAPTGRTAP